MRRTAFVFLLCCLAVLSLQGEALGAEQFSVRPQGSIVGYSENVLVISAPEAGKVSVEIRDDYSLFRRLEMDVKAGETKLVWDGLREDLQRIGIANVDCLLTASLLATDGTEYAYSSAVSVKKSRQTLLFALPSSEKLYLGGGESWFAEMCLVRKGTAVMEVYAPSGKEPLAVRKFTFTSDRPKKCSWDGTVGKTLLAPGAYRVRCYALENPEWDHEFSLTLVEGAAPVLPVEPTGKILPDDSDDDAAIWALMMKPSVVVDIKNTNHQKVYASPSTQSASLGTLHGQSQALEVLSVENGFACVKAWQHEDGGPVTGYVPADKLKVVTPSGEYGLLVDKRTQTLKLYRRGEVVTEFSVSTGLVAKNRLIRETAAGAFLTVEHMGGFAESSKHYAYPVRYDGGNLFHQLGYSAKNQHADFNEHRAQLGRKASHACIRIPDSPVDESGVDAFWLWTHIPWHTRVMILDDPETREAQKAAVLSGTPVSAAPQGTASPRAEESGEPAQAVSSNQLTLRPVAEPVVSDDPPAVPEISFTAPSPDADAVVLTLGGDVVLGTRETWWNRQDALPAYLDKYGMGWPLSGMQALFATDDMTLVNLECVLKDDRTGEDTAKKYRFRGLTTWTEALKKGSVEQVNIANNHYIDYGTAGKRTTRLALEKAGIPYSGYGYTYIFEKNGHKIGFSGIRETIYKQDKRRMAREVAALREQGCQVVIVSCHWGEEYSPAHNETQLEMARAAVAAGADLVVGTHPHVVQGIDLMGHTPVLWSLGNLMFGGTIEMTTFDAVVARVNLLFSGSSYRGCALELIPVMTSGRASGGVNDFRPLPAVGADRERILQLIRNDGGTEPEGVMWFSAK